MCSRWLQRCRGAEAQFIVGADSCITRWCLAHPHTRRAYQHCTRHTIMQPGWTSFRLLAASPLELTCGNGLRELTAIVNSTLGLPLRAHPVMASGSRLEHHALYFSRSARTWADAGRRTADVSSQQDGAGVQQGTLKVSHTHAESAAAQSCAHTSLSSSVHDREQVCTRVWGRCMGAGVAVQEQSWSLPQALHGSGAQTLRA